MQDQPMTGYESQVQALIGTLPGTDDLRAQALEAFEAEGFPTAKTEDWRYSDIRALRKQVYGLAAPAETLPVLPEPLGAVSARFVFVNGHYDEDQSDLGDLWQTVQIRPLANHFMANAERANELVRGDDAISYLNTALLRDGLVLSVPAGVVIDAPIEVLHMMTGAEGAATHIRHVVELGEGAKATVVERFLGDETGYWTNALFQARVAEGASLSHIRVQEEGANALHTAKAYVNIDAEGSYTSVGLSVGGKTARFEAHVRLLGEEACAVVDGVALAASGQSHDTFSHVSHTVPAATSDQIFRTIADSRGKTSFAGKVTVAKDAQKTEADQSFKALVFDKTAEANAKPELEIFADDVKCSHGATVGELDAKAIYYLTSRGIDPATARQMLVAAFTAAALERVPAEDVKAAMADRIDAWMTARSVKAVA
ncbi:Fe-S cluster assembly protein SufD [Kordiimonas marina]|uniref:Fe-S cluster assembly protein SufD n=1 Tax=Kordiimonas marina TaxID=2872312 RepID=UPI001FF39C1E|nr:Fe-S cluster assembly protein SufD [Kordiimonas marina]MCJ9430111.1 Fe-S cluster assembly protein SufD [Kordiimonas marina]